MQNHSFEKTKQEIINEVVERNYAGFLYQSPGKESVIRNFENARYDYQFGDVQGRLLAAKKMFYYYKVMQLYEKYPYSDYDTFDDNYCTDDFIAAAFCSEQGREFFDTDERSFFARVNEKYQEKFEMQEAALFSRIAEESRAQNDIDYQRKWLKKGVSEIVKEVSETYQEFLDRNSSKIIGSRCLKALQEIEKIHARVLASASATDCINAAVDFLLKNRYILRVTNAPQASDEQLTIDDELAKPILNEYLTRYAGFIWATKIKSIFDNDSFDAISMICKNLLEEAGVISAAVIPEYIERTPYSEEELNIFKFDRTYYYDELKQINNLNELIDTCNISNAAKKKAGEMVEGILNAIVDVRIERKTEQVFTCAAYAMIKVREFFRIVMENGNLEEERIKYNNEEDYALYRDSFIEIFDSNTTELRKYFVNVNVIRDLGIKISEKINASDYEITPEKYHELTYVEPEEVRLERERLEKEAAERERLEQERLERERLERERLEQERLERERLERERLERERLEQERLEQERLERERLERERLEQERLERERLERERLEQERLERERLEQERLEQERLERERLEQERLERERLEQERLEQERLERERLERERLEQERLERERLEQERLEQERLERERLERERLEQERLERERLEQERLEQERLEQDRLERERLEQERLERERLEQERLEQERLERERLEQERLEQERLEQERLEQERLEQERLEQERLERERLEQERLEQERLANESLEERNQRLRREAIQKILIDNMSVFLEQELGVDSGEEILDAIEKGTITFGTNDNRNGFLLNASEPREALGRICATILNGDCNVFLSLPTSDARIAEYRLNISDEGIPSIEEYESVSKIKFVSDNLKHIYDSIEEMAEDTNDSEKFNDFRRVLCEKLSLGIPYSASKFKTVVDELEESAYKYFFARLDEDQSQDDSRTGFRQIAKALEVISAAREDRKPSILNMEKTIIAAKALKAKFIQNLDSDNEEKVQKAQNALSSKEKFMEKVERLKIKSAFKNVVEDKDIHQLQELSQKSAKALKKIIAKAKD